MNLHEYQAKELLSRYGIPVPSGKMAAKAGDAGRIAQDLGGSCVVKAQVHAGGRGKAGGIRLASNASEARARASEILGMRLVTPQTGPEGKVVRKVLVEEAREIDREFYLGLTTDRARGVVSVLASTEGGVEIEEVAARSPEKIIRAVVDPACGYSAYVGRRIAYGLGLQGAKARELGGLVGDLVRLYLERDCSLVEINPLTLTKGEQLLALDAKINIDDNALFRQEEIAALRDREEEDPKELEAAQHGLSYIRLDGNIGCLVNGAGLAMATMDLIMLHGGEPANFLDVGGGASAEQVRRAFEIILADPKVKGVLVNIFGGIMRCDTIAEGIVAAASGIDIRMPLVVRLEGTNVERGRRLLAASGLPIVSAKGMEDAAKKIIKAVGGEVKRPVRSADRKKAGRKVQPKTKRTSSKLKGKARR